MSLATTLNLLSRLSPPLTRRTSASQIPVLQYHGSPAARQELRRTRLSAPIDGDGGALGYGKMIHPKTKAEKKAAQNLKKVKRNTKDTFPIVITSSVPFPSEAFRINSS